MNRHDFRFDVDPAFDLWDDDDDDEQRVADLAAMRRTPRTPRRSRTSKPQNTTSATSSASDNGAEPPPRSELRNFPNCPIDLERRARERIDQLVIGQPLPVDVQAIVVDVSGEVHVLADRVVLEHAFSSSSEVRHFVRSRPRGEVPVALELNDERNGPVTIVTSVRMAPLAKGGES